MIREGKPRKWLISAMVLGLLLLGIGPIALWTSNEAAAAGNAAIKLNGKTVKLAAPIELRWGRIYVPAAGVAALTGAETSWDNDNEELTIHTALDDTIVLGNRVPVVYFNELRYRMDALPYTSNGRLYVPIRQLAELLHANLLGSADEGEVELVTVEPAVVNADTSLDEISKRFSVSKSVLINRNVLDVKSAVKAGTKLKVVIPSFFDQIQPDYTQSDLMLLAKIVMVEAGYEGYEGQLAVANVILNRVKSSEFPDTIRGVIYSGRQFPPAHNGLLDKSKPHAGAIRAAKDALNGKNNVDGAVYFFNPDRAKGSYWTSMNVVVTIGNHSFAE